MKKAIFITFEGGEGSGKSTLIQALTVRFRKEGLSVFTTREPGGTQIGEAIRTVLLSHATGTLTPEAELFLFLASRAEHVDQVILPALQEHDLVFCDRFNDSTVAYQGYARGLDPIWVNKMCLFACRDLEPDLTFYLDVAPEIGLARTRGRPGQDRIEKETLTFHQKIREGYLSLHQEYPARIVKINAATSKDEVAEEVRAKIRACLMTS